MKFLVALLIIAAFTFSGDNYTLHTEPYIVHEGETVWEIACQYMPRQDKIRDVRELVYDIRVHNNLTNYMIHAGDVIEVPLWKKE